MRAEHCTEFSHSLDPERSIVNVRFAARQNAIVQPVIWTVDLFLITGNLRAHIMGWAVLLLNLFLIFANWSIYSPLLVFRSPAKSSFWSKGAGKT